MTRDVTAFKAYAQIQRQPAELARVLEAPEPVESAAELVRDAQHVHAVGTGTSYNAALLGASWLRAAGLDARAWAAFDFSLYGPELRSGDVAIVYSHSGRKRYSRRALERAREAGVPSIWIAARNPDADNPATVVLQTVGRETSPMFTVSHTAAMLMTARVVDRIQKTALGELKVVPDAVAGALEREDIAAGLAAQWCRKGSIVAVGGGPHEASAWEVAIKVNEGPRMRARGYAVEQFLHGPQAQMQPDDALVVFSSAGAAQERARAVAAFGCTIGVPVAWIGSDEPPRGVTALPVRDVGEALAPIVQAVPGQLLAAHLAARRGVDCDAFRLDDPVFKRAYAHYAL
ncbi:MAG: SIS domain-containing protein [Gammaproteobacteria bacterium]|nr:SIS domain-containing protein [Gammaproteobacteria bacterium]NIR83624.1 SIS domain-containing protein [Gammaproteobacteria bacterium]NIR91597.1 SIS domain-containing protein [Gammaproteobacteria bacterium]NIU04786.1 SIS domain-containing protein [Gammaproteobacteria bacterium]NIV53136.1 SIS domain-containing protein [Gammaproteobacteria bacterium]